MRYFAVALLLLLSSCMSGFDINSASIANTYKIEDKSINISDKNISGFLNLNGLSGSGEVVNIMIYNNAIEKIDVSDYDDLKRLNISNNNITFFADLILPSKIEHLIISDNNLKNLEAIASLTSLKTLDIRNNLLDKDSLKALSGMSHLEMILIDGNQDIPQNIIEQFNDFNQKYISSIKNSQDLDPKKHSFLE